MNRCSVRCRERVLNCRAGACPRRVQELPFWLRAKGEWLWCALRARISNGTPGRRALRSVCRSCSVGRDHWARRVQELPNLHKLVRLYRLPLRGRMGHAPSLQPSIETFMWRYSTPRRYRPRVQAPGSNCASPRHAASTPSISAGFSVVNDRRTAHRPRRRSSSFLSSR